MSRAYMDPESIEKESMAIISRKRSYSLNLKASRFQKIPFSKTRNLAIA